MSDREVAVRDRLRHMVDAADAISGYVVRGRAAFDADPAIRDAILALRRAVDAALATSR